MPTNPDRERDAEIAELLAKRNELLAKADEMAKRPGERSAAELAEMQATADEMGSVAAKLSAHEAKLKKQINALDAGAQLLEDGQKTVKLAEAEKAAQEGGWHETRARFNSMFNRVQEMLAEGRRTEYTDGES
ncbi:hypothetical protein BDY17DRAFT_322510 [Neohortaea acidophila]|uniref:Uncharacterized protein n=1 Tax=Neohortaea acidophila TaxID=245834 RepID=A0A6A6PZQ1_9PEZI|nr:uncharacterized protein BDY17DRAFT_322510 [Neohortaea acidophila]KAF2485688.1 hypothetical protein BDY17DRAFT_322510 [Neohortaea acidophila]